MITRKRNLGEKKTKNEMEMEMKMKKKRKNIHKKRDMITTINRATIIGYYYEYCVL